MSTAMSTPIKLRSRTEPVQTGQPPRVAYFTRLWVNALCIALLGYAVMGRGFAYLGIPPMFVGELLLFVGLACLLVCGRWWVILKTPQMTALTVLCCWCAIRTIPFIKPYGMDAMRDAIIWGYSLFAFTLAGVIICQPQLLVLIVNKYKYFVKIFLISVPFLWIAFQFFHEDFIRWPWASDIPILYLKAGDLQVHLGGIIGFWAGEVAGSTATIWFIPMFINAAMLGPVNRGGMMAFISSLGVSMIFKPLNRWAWSFIIIAVFGISVLLATGLSFNIPGSQRPISAEQLIGNFISIFGGGKQGDLEELQGTKQWRMDFWKAIIDDTVYGPYFWKGKGFGVNLVSEYGFNIDAEETVRAPHNGHMTMLARSGVPGATLWAIVHASWALGMVDGYIRSFFAGRKRWAGLFMWLLIYWLCVVINCSFDPYIEGPMGGVWLWCIYGMGVAAMYLRRREPNLLDIPEPPPIDQGREGDPLTEMAAQ